MEAPVAEEGTALYHYQKRGLTKDRRQRLYHINKGLDILTNKEDTLYIDLLRHKAINHYYLDDFDSTVQAATKLISEAEEEDTWNKARGHFFRGWAFRKLGLNEVAFKNSFRAKELFIKLSDSAYAGRAWFNMAIVQQNAGDYAGAQQSATETLKFLHPERDSSFIAAAYNEIGRSYYSQSLYADASSAYLEASNLSVNNNDNIIHSANLANSLSKTGNIGEATEIFKRLLKTEDLLPELKIAYQLELAYLRHQQDPSLDISKELEAARLFFLERNDLRKLQLTYKYLINYYKERDPKLAAEYARKRLSAAITYGNPQSKLNALENIVELGSPVESRSAALEFISLSDSLSNARMRTRNLFAKIQYDEEQKELEILGLETENALQLARIAKQQQRMTIFGSLGVVLVLVSLFILYYFRQRHKREKQQQVSATEARISKRVHDELANDVYVLMTQLENKISEDASDQLENIYERTRDISRENSRVRTGKEFKEELNGMLNSYTPAGARLFINNLEEMPWESVPPGNQIAVYRSLQELMTNMKKHSKAKVVVIDFRQEKDYIRIKYADRGVGIDETDLKYRNGLQNVENRISSIEGSFTFESNLGEGVKAYFSIPL